jgi:hypothetical protein
LILTQLPTPTSAASKKFLPSPPTRARWGRSGQELSHAVKRLKRNIHLSGEQTDELAAIVARLVANLGRRRLCS